MNTEDYRKALEGITETVVKANVGDVKKRPNGSALIRIRTNDSAGNLLWQLREFQIDPTLKYPVATTVKQTPSKQFKDHMDDSVVLADWINDNEQEILAERHVVPKWPAFSELHFLGGEDTQPKISGHWGIEMARMGRIRNPVARHKFSLNTCSGCHGGEAQIDFAHIVPRLSTKEAQLSAFLTGVEPTDKSTAIARDPIDGTPRQFKDLERRNQDMALLLGAPALSALSFQPTGRTH